MTSTPRHDPEEMRDASCRDRVLVDLLRGQLATPADRPSPDDAVAEASIQLHGAQRECGDRLLQHPAKPGRRARRAHRVLSLSLSLRGPPRTRTLDPLINYQVSVRRNSRC